MMPAGNEAKLIALAQLGSLAAFNQLVQAHQATIYNVLFWAESDPQRAEKLIETALRHAYRCLAAYGGGSFRAWLMGIAWNECRRGRRQFRPRTVVAGTAATATPTVAGALNVLNPEERWLLVLADCAGFDYEEIGSIAGIGEREVARRLALARLHLARILHQETRSPAGTS